MVFLLWQYREVKIMFHHTIFGLWFATPIGMRSFYPHSTFFPCYLQHVLDAHSLKNCSD